MRIIGIDPGLRITGYGCVDVEPGVPEPRLVEGGVFRLTVGASLSRRLEQLHEDLATLFDELRPDHVVVEKIFTHYRHLRTSILMGHARGVVLLAAQQRGIEPGELAATEIKKAMTGNGHASKMQVQLAVMSQCGLPELPSPPDVADAIAIAMCAGRRLAGAEAAAVTR